MPPSPSTQSLFLALADHTRRQLIETLANEGEKSATELAAIFPITRQGISKHLRILLDANLVQVRQQGRDKLYHLQPEQLREATAWINNIQSQWDRRLQTLSTYLDKTNKE
ncbi:MAG: metalloregulator ArsR/SmtB family transcription factor [Chloroflexota bacterium]